MDQLLHSLIGFVSDHAGWAYATVLLAALLEAIPVVGSFVPGTTIVVAISALVSSGRLSVSIILVAAILGGGLGDGLSFWIGHRVKRHILELWPLSAYPNVVAQSEEFFHRRGMLAVFFARFVAPVRAFVPIIAGAMGMPPRRFFAVNIPAVFLWAASHVLTSAFAGDMVERAMFGAWREQLEPYAIPVVAVITLTAFAVWAVRHWHLSAPKLVHAMQRRHQAHPVKPEENQPRATDLR